MIIKLKKNAFSLLSRLSLISLALSLSLAPHGPHTLQLQPKTLTNQIKKLTEQKDGRIQDLIFFSFLHFSG
jgi:hypothetical protein